MKEFTLPSLGADMDEGMLAAWLVAPGEEVSRGQIIAEVETDKGIIEVEIWEDATITDLLVEPGETRLAVGTPIAMIAEPGEALPEAGPAERIERHEDADEDVVAGEAVAVAADRQPMPVARAEPTVTPPVRHLAHQLGVDLAVVAGTGTGGAITRDDVRVAAGGNGHRPASRPMITPRARRMAIDRGIDVATLRATRPDGIVAAADVPSAERAPGATATPEATDARSAMRRAIARSMERSKREIPHYYLGSEIDLAAAMTWLDAVNADRPVTKRILPATLLLKATALALREHPEMNGHWVDGSFREAGSVHLGVAVSLRGGGLVAPAIHDAERLGLDELMVALADLVARARAGRLRGSEMSEQTCTVTNLGDRGVDRTFPVIIPPQVAIVGFGRITDRPVAVEGTVVVRPVVEASLAADHRVTDGHTGGLFVRTIDRRLQEPDQL